MRTVFAVIAVVCAVGLLAAQPVPTTPPQSPPPPAPLPAGQIVSSPVAVGIDPGGLPGGKDVSQPLQPVGPEPSAPKSHPEPKPPREPYQPEATEAKAIPPERPRGPLGPSWDDFELLYWWPMRQPVPALGFGTPSGQPPVPGQDGTQLLVGGRSLGSQPSAGGRFTLGVAVNDDETLGLDVTYLFLGTRTFTQTARDYGGGTTANFGVPYTDPATGATGVLPLAQPGITHAALTAATSVSVQGWEVNTLANVLDEKYVKLNAVLGWRYFQVHEGLQLASAQTRLADGSVIGTADLFDTANRFNGGQIGLHADARHGIVFCEITAKVAFGQSYEVTREQGLTTVQPFGGQGPVTRTYPGGIYVQPSNAGRSASGVFAVLPEGTFKFGFRLGDVSRVYVGYSFLYLSDAVRPGDQIDRTLHPGQVPLVSGVGPVVGSDRPSHLFNRSDFWAQGLVIGLETRY
jgi:hypothetical protein